MDKVLRVILSILILTTVMSPVIHSMEYTSVGPVVEILVKGIETEWYPTVAYDGAYLYVAMQTFSLATDWDTLLVKMNDTDTLWALIFDGVTSPVLSINGSWIYIAGVIGNDIFLAKLDPIGNIAWARQVGTSGAEDAPVIYVNGSWLYLAGTTDYLGSDDIFLSKFDGNGNLVWSIVIGDINLEIQPRIYVNGSWVYLSGITSSYGAGISDIFVAKIDSAGNILWVKTIGTSNSENNGGIYVNGSWIYIVASYYPPGSNYFDVAFVKLDANGNLVWAKAFGGSNHDEYPRVLVNGTDVYVVAQTRSFGAGNGDTLIAKFDGNGNLLWSVTRGYPDYELYPRPIIVDNWLYIAVQYRSIATGDYDSLIIKVDSNGWPGTPCAPSVYDWAPTILDWQAPVQSLALSVNTASPGIVAWTPTVSSTIAYTTVRVSYNETAGVMVVNATRFDGVVETEQVSAVSGVISRHWGWVAEAQGVILYSPVEILSVNASSNKVSFTLSAPTNVSIGAATGIINEIYKDGILVCAGTCDGLRDVDGVIAFDPSTIDVILSASLGSSTGIGAGGVAAEGAVRLGGTAEPYSISSYVLLSILIGAIAYLIRRPSR